VQTDLVPDRGHLDAQVHVVRQERLARRRFASGDDPVVRADAFLAGLQQGAQVSRFRQAACPRFRPATSLGTMKGWPEG